MRNLRYYLENPFDDDGISVAELGAFATDHMQKMIANNPGALFAARITATNVAMLAFEGCITDDGTKLALRKSRKEAKDLYRKVLPEKVTMIHAVVVAKYGPNAVEVTECFPEGRSVFSKCTDDLVENKLQILIAGLTAHQADLGPQVVGDAGGLLSGWLSVYNASETSSGAKTLSESQKETARLNLQLELYKNLLTIGLNFPRQPEKVDDYMQQSLLEDRPRSTTPAPAPAPGPAP